MLLQLLFVFEFPSAFAVGAVVRVLWHVINQGVNKLSKALYFLQFIIVSDVL